MLNKFGSGAGLHVLAPAVSLVEASGVPFEALVARGDPAHTLVEILERHACDAVILSAHGASGFRTQLGAVAHEMVQIAPVPVTVVRPAERDSD